MTPTLEAMTETHLDAVAKIERTTFSSPWTRRNFEFALKRDNSICHVLLVDAEVIGYSVGFLIDREFHLADFAIAPTFQRKGFARKLLEEVCDLLNAKAHVVSLEVRMSNQIAIDFYKQMGFETMAIRKSYYTRPREDALVMLKPLNGRLSDWVSNVLPGALKKHDGA
ncbi:MAG: ribosomal protein S18-alanine N-acetyltransferase [Candidatus Latescibacteria bacterium]|jgi:ribosomal-protein-alanine N-acetyltransferase|nr:ribosomal protein S18-alanine N-acetyltransferase [Candidatus Latescibacterota bacterium]